MSCNLPEVEQAASVLDTCGPGGDMVMLLKYGGSCMHVELESQAYRVHEGTDN
jgi:hypothetical protein